MDKFKEKLTELSQKMYELLNRERKAVKRIKKRPVLLWVLTIILACSVGFGTMYYEVYAKKRRESYERIYESLYLTFADGTPEVFEYSQGSLDLASYAADSNGTVSVQPKTLDLMKTGTVEAVYTVSQTDEYRQVIRRTFERTFRVEDNHPPVITLSGSALLSPGDAFDAGSFILSVEDPVDGALPYAEQRPESPGKGWYTVEHNVDPSVEGNYTMTVYACDRNGKTAQAEMQIIVAQQLHEQVMASWQFSDHWYEPQEIRLIGVDVETAPTTGRFSTQEEALSAYGQLPKADLTEGCEAYRGSWYKCERSSTLDDRYYIVRGIDNSGNVHYYRILYSYSEHGSGYVDPETGRWTFTDWFID